jgi:hypothetical protein
MMPKLRPCDRCQRWKDEACRLGLVAPRTDSLIIRECPYILEYEQAIEGPRQKPIPENDG